MAFFDLSGKHALVTGATGPLQRALAVALAGERNAEWALVTDGLIGDCRLECCIFSLGGSTAELQAIRALVTEHHAILPTLTAITAHDAGRADTARVRPLTLFQRCAASAWRSAFPPGCS